MVFKVTRNSHFLRDQISHEIGDMYYIVFLHPPNVPLLRALWSLLDGIWGSLKGSCVVP